MIDVEPVILSEFDRMVPRTLASTDWANVVARADAMAPPPAVSLRRSRGSRRLLLIAALLGALVVVASAFAATGHDPFGTISSWLDGSPGKPASQNEQARFSARNDASYAGFPAGTKLRQLEQTVAAGKTFDLLGLKSGESLCLELVRADLSSTRGRDECVTLRELDMSQSPALVVSQAHFQAGVPGQEVDGIFGFADDTVRSVEYRRGRGAWETTRVTNNVFVGLDAKRATGVRGPHLAPIVQVRAVTRSGKLVTVPFVSGAASYPTGLPSVPT